MNSNQREEEREETWGIQVNNIDWEYFPTETQPIQLRFQFWESGGAFVKKFPFYIENLVKNARIVIYMFAAPDFHSVDDLTNHVTHTRKVWERSLEKKYKKLLEFVYITKTDLTLDGFA